MTAVIANPTSTEATFATIPLDEIIPAPDNVRTDLGELDGLVASIASVGLIEPLAVERCASNDHGADHGFHILAGERRWTAARLAGLTAVPCMVRDAVVDDGARAELMLIENLQRQDLHPMEEAGGYQRLAALGLSQRTIADRVGCSQAHVSRRLALLDLPAPVQAKVDTGDITVADAHELLKLKEHPKELAAALKAPKHLGIARSVENSVKELEAEAKYSKLAEEAKAKGWKIIKPPTGYSAKKTHWRIIKPGAGYGYGDDVEVDPAKHRKEPCHGVVINKGWGGVNQTEVCTDKARHGPKGASDLKVPKEKRPKRSPHEQKELDDARHRKAAAARRLEALPALVAKRTPADEAVAMLARATIDQLGYDEIKAACTLLGLPQPQYRNDVLWGETDKGLEDLVRVAVACALARGHEAARSPHRIWTSSVAWLYDYLAKREYELDAFEQEKLTAGRKDDEEDAAALAELDVFRTEEVRAVQLSGPAGDGSWRVICDYCDERGEERGVVAEVATESEALTARAAHLDDPHGVRACRVCSCSQFEPCEDGCSWLSEDLCDSPSCATGAEVELDAEGPAETETVGEPNTQVMSTITVKKAGKRWKVSCTACGDIGHNTTEAYAEERGRDHVTLDHALVDAETEGATV